MCNEEELEDVTYKPVEQPVTRKTRGAIVDVEWILKVRGLSVDL